MCTVLFILSPSTAPKHVAKEIIISVATVAETLYLQSFVSALCISYNTP